MIIELPEPMIFQQYEFIGAQLTRRYNRYGGPSSFTDVHLIARLDRGDALEIVDNRAMDAAWLAGKAAAPSMMVDWSQDAGPQE